MCRSEILVVTSSTDTSTTRKSVRSNPAAAALLELGAQADQKWVSIVKYYRKLYL